MHCRECESIVTRTDRFCPACGTPNGHARFHPKFGPALRVRDPQIIDEPAPDGVPACPRCRRAIERPDEYCRACGMDLAGAWRRHRRIEVLDAWRRQPGFELHPYRAPDRLATALAAVLTVGAALAAAIALGQLWRYAQAQGVRWDGVPADEVAHWSSMATPVAVGLFVVGMALLMAWMRRAYRNLPALAVSGLRFGPGWAVAGWLVPGIDLFRPKQLVDDLWRASDPRVVPFSAAWRSAAPPAWSALWWSTLLVGGILGLTSVVVRPATPAGDEAAALLLAGGSGLLLAASALSLEVLVLRISGRQEARARLVALDADALDGSALVGADGAAGGRRAGRRSGTGDRDLGPSDRRGGRSGDRPGDHPGDRTGTADGQGAGAVAVGQVLAHPVGPGTIWGRY